MNNTPKTVNAILSPTMARSRFRDHENETAGTFGSLKTGPLAANQPIPEMMQIHTSSIFAQKELLPTATYKDKQFTFAPHSMSPANAGTRVKNGSTSHAGKINYDEIGRLYTKNKDQADALVKDFKHVNPEHLPWGEPGSLKLAVDRFTKLLSRGQTTKFGAIVHLAYSQGSPVSPGSSLWSAPVGNDHRITFRFIPSEGATKVKFASEKDKQDVIAHGKSAYRKAAIQWLRGLGMVDTVKSAKQGYSNSREKLMINPADPQVSDEQVGAAVRNVLRKLVKAAGKQDENGADLYKGNVNGRTAQAYVKTDGDDKIEYVHFLP